MVRLFIENTEIELTDDIQIAITKQFEDLSNPTLIINDWSKTVSIPFTKNNNQTFGYIYNPDRTTIVTDNQALVGMYFDPLKKLSFRLTWLNVVLMTGYAKMNEIKMVNGKGTYEITLFGQLGKIFQDLKKITFNVNDENTDYIIDGSQYVDAIINKELVKSSWTSSGQTHVGLSGASVTDIIGFAPNNSYYEEFNCDTYQSGSATSTPFTDVLESRWADGNGGYTTGVAPDTAIPNGLLPREIGEFRSYYQLPYIYWNKLWQIFQAKAEQITGYSWDLDTSWFNVDNPYFYKLVYMLKPFNVKNGESKENHYTKWGKDATMRSLGRSTTPNSPQVVQKLAMPTGSSVVTNNKLETYPLLLSYDDPYYAQSYPHYPTNVAVFSCPDEFSSITFKWSIPMYFLTKVSSSHIRDNSGLIVKMKMWGCDDRVTQANARLIQTNSYIIRHEGSGFTYSDYTPIDTGTSSSEGAHRYEIYWTLNSNFAASAAKCGPYCYFTLECSFTNGDPITNGLGDAAYTYYRESAYVDVAMSSGAFRTGVNFTLNDLWDNNYNIFEQILNYCKMYRIMTYVDEAQKKIVFQRATTYFDGYDIFDWTEKVDKSKDFIITPVSFENKYVIFNYADTDSKLGKKYKETWGVNYGEKKLITQYNFNEEKKDLFDKEITSSITNTDFALSWTNLYDYSKISYSLPAEVFPYAKDDDGKAISMFGAFFFHNGKRNFDTTAALRMRGCNISDDTTFQQSNDTYYYSQVQGMISCSTYPALDIVDSTGQYLCLFNKPMENFTYSKNLSNTSGIYDQFWKLYIDERYNIQNKKVTCYLRLTPQDWINFWFSNFVKIGNQLYIVNKIYDYNIMSNESVKVDLITVQDVQAYVVDPWNDYLNISSQSVVIDGASGTQTVTIDAYKTWNFEIYDQFGEVVSNPTEITVTKVNNTTLSITKNQDTMIHFTIRVYTLTKSENITVSGARAQYISLTPNTIVAVKGTTTEFDIRCQTNLKNVNMVADSTVQWWNGSTWKTTAFSAAGAVENWGSPSEDDTYNNAHEDRDFTIHIKVVNPTQNRQISFFEEMPAYVHYYVNIVAVNSPTITNTEKTQEMSTETIVYGSSSTIRGYYVYASEMWTLTLPSGVRSYGATSGSSGWTPITIDWGNFGAGQSKTITVTDNSMNTWDLTCNYVSS